MLKYFENRFSLPFLKCEKELRRPKEARKYANTRLSKKFYRVTFFRRNHEKNNYNYQREKGTNKVGQTVTLFFSIHN